MKPRSPNSDVAQMAKCTKRIRATIAAALERDTDVIIDLAIQLAAAYLGHEFPHDKRHQLRLRNSRAFWVWWFLEWHRRDESFIRFRWPETVHLHTARSTQTGRYTSILLVHEDGEALIDVYKDWHILALQEGTLYLPFHLRLNTPQA